MKRKVLVVSLLAMLSLTVFVAVSAVAVFALTSNTAQVEAIQVDDAVEVAPVQVEAPAQIEVVDSVRQYERTSHAGRSDGCPYSSAKMQLTEAPSQNLESDQLVQAQQ